MQLHEVTQFIAAGDIERITLWRPSPLSAWSVYAYGETLSETTIHHLELNDAGTKRTWSDLDAAYTFVRKSGYHQIIEVDEGKAKD